MTTHYDLEAKITEALMMNRIGFKSVDVIGQVVHVECKAASSANMAADILANFCVGVHVWDSINDDDRHNVHKVFRVAGRF